MPFQLTEADRQALRHGDTARNELIAHLDSAFCAGWDAVHEWGKTYSTTPEAPTFPPKPELAEVDCGNPLTLGCFTSGGKPSSPMGLQRRSRGRWKTAAIWC